MDFSDEVFVSAAEVEDNNEVIEHLSNLAFDKSSGGDLMSFNPKVCGRAQDQEHSARWVQYQKCGCKPSLMLAQLSLTKIHLFLNPPYGETLLYLSPLMLHKNSVQLSIQLPLFYLGCATGATLSDTINLCPETLDSDKEKLTQSKP